MDRILLGQLGANGDCLYATILARQIREDFPKAELTWAVSSQCKSVLENNPHVDHVEEIPTADWSEHELMWRLFEREALRRYQRREYDGVLLSQIWPNNFQNFDGTVRPSILRAYGKPITVPIENVIRLTAREIERVEAFAMEHRLDEREHVVLFECSSKSGQSFITPEKAQDVADELYKLLPEATTLLSTHFPLTVRDKRSIYAGTLTLREVAHLTHHSCLFVGAGSGGSVAASSSASRPLPMVQLLAASTSVFASFAHDFEYFGFTEQPVLEMTKDDPVSIARCIASILTEGIGAAFERFEGRVPINFEHYFHLTEQCLIKHFRILDAAQSLSITAARYGWTKDLLRFGRQKIAPKLALDPSWHFADSRRKGDAFRTTLLEAGTGAQYPHQRPWAGAAPTGC